MPVPALAPAGAAPAGAAPMLLAMDPSLRPDGGAACSCITPLADASIASASGSGCGVRCHMMAGCALAVTAAGCSAAQPAGSTSTRTRAPRRARDGQNTEMYTSATVLPGANACANAAHLAHPAC
eukprot:SAG22_NODE_506_length_9643_cov_5.853206_6_plen_125_part_00